MINLRPKVIVTLLVVSTTSATLRVVDGRSLRSNKERDEIIDICKFKEDPSQFAGKTFRLKAVLVENRTPRVDGGESYLYGPGCRKSSLKT